MGMRQSFGLFLPPLTHDLGLTAADFTFAVAVQNITWGLSQAPAGAIADKYGLRPVMLLGGIVYVIGMLVMLSAGGAPTLAVSGDAWSGIALACTASSLAMTAAARAVSPERRSVILGAVGACASVGTLVIAPSLQFLLARWQWHARRAVFFAGAVRSRFCRLLSWPAGSIAFRRLPKNAPPCARCLARPCAIAVIW